MSRWIKNSLKVIGILLGLILLLWMGVAAYVHTHKKQLLASITNQLNEDLNGKLTIASMEPALIRGFPGISVSLKNVLLRDSLWGKHHHDLLRAKDVHVSVNAFSILRGDPTIKSIRISDGNIYLFVDSAGYSNTNLFKKKSGKGSGGRRKINRIYLNNVNVVFENRSRKKLFNFSIHDFLGEINYNRNGWSANVLIRTLVKDFAFNTRLGSFLKNKKLNANLEMNFNSSTNVLRVPLQNIKFDDDRMEIGGKFAFAPNSSDFNLDVKAHDITFKNASSLLTPNISSKLSPYNLKNPFSVQGNIIGKLNGSGNPLIRVYWQVKDDNTLRFKEDSIENSNFSGYFNNEVVAGMGRIDQNSAISFYQMRGTWLGIPFKADSITITNLAIPILAGKFIANFPLAKLNSVLGDQTFLFNNGVARLNLLYHAPFKPEDPGKRSINGTIQINNASVTYSPRNLSFKKVMATLNFSGQDLFIQNMQVKSGSSMMHMEGSIKNFLNLYYSDPHKILLDWDIKSPQINLNEFLVFLGKRRGNKNFSAASKVSKFSHQLDKMLDQANVHMKMQVDRLVYKKFIAKNVHSDITLRHSGIALNNVSLNHAGGSLKLNGNIDQSRAINRLKVNTRIANANVQELFYAFDNFGQDAITNQHLKGSLNADINASALMRDNGQIVPGSIQGKVNFNLRNGAIVNFEPMRKIGAFAFPNRNFSYITFENLKNTLYIQGRTVNIPPMQIESSVLNIFLEGVYGFNSGTNIALQIPLRNPKNDGLILDEAEKEKRSKRGIVLYLHAVDGDDGKVKFKLGK